MSRLSVFFALLIGCCSCGRGASVAVVYEVSARKMEGLDDIFDFYGPFFFDEADSCLVKSEGQGENVVVRFDCRKGVLKNRIRRGRGPGEYLDLRVVGVNPATGDFQAVSSVGRSVVSFSREMVPLDTVTFGTALFDAVRAGDFFVSYGDYAATDNHMFSLFDTLGQAVGRFGKFPDDGMSDAFRDKVMAYQGKLLANRTCSRFAFFSSMGNVFDIYGIGANRCPVRIASIRKELPVYEPQPHVAAGVRFRDPAIHYADAASSDRRIYALYSGRKLDMGTVDPDRRARETRLIRVYDWNGVHRCDLLADIPLLNLCVSSDDRYIIGLFSEDGEIRCCRLDLPEALYR